MPPIPPFLAYALTFGVYGKYALIAVGMLIGGPFLIFLSGILLRLGFVELVPLFIAIAIGELTMDTIWYVIGYSYTDRFIERFGKYVNFTSSSYENIKSLFARYHASILFGSKVLMGLGMAIPILITAGATKIKFWKYLLWNALGEMVWVSMMLYIGYAYASLYARVALGLRIQFIIGTVILVALIGYGIVAHARGRFLKK